MNNLVSFMPLAGDRISWLPFVLIAVAVIIIVVLLIVSKKRQH